MYIVINLPLCIEQKRLAEEEQKIIIDTHMAYQPAMAGKC
jgi:hypothetical protein